MKLCLVLIAGAGMAFAADKPRVYVTDSHSLQLASETASPDAKSGFVISGHASPESIEVIRALSAQCPGVVVTSNREKADFVVRFDREGPSPVTPFVRGNKVAVFNKNEDLIYSASTRMLTPAVKGVCKAIGQK
jgi:hypothetical protein